MFYKSDRPKIPIVYSPGYNITFFGLENLHPFDSKKYRRVHKRLISRRPIKNPNFLITKPLGMLPPLLHRSQFYCPKMPTATDLSLIHSQTYLDSLTSPKNIASIVEVPPISFLPISLIRARLLKPMLLATGGSKLAAELALTEGWAINLGGGFHHASRDNGGGFCVYADITLAVRHVLEGVKPEKRLKKVMIVDLDAHQGNGHERDFMNDTRVHIFDCFNKEIYPQDSLAENAISTSILLHSHSTNTSEPRYIERLSETLRPAIESFGPEFILYNAGTDCMKGDPLGEMMLGFDGIVERDELVFRLAREVARCPVMMVLSGGYQKQNAEVISASIFNLIDKFDLMPKAG